MAYKVFQNGFPLSAGELNNYLMNQTVMVFASSAERASVLTTPVEGMVTWLQDTNVFQVYNGTAWTDINDNTAYIPKSLLTTQGDLIVSNGTEPVRLPLGTNGQVLQSNGTTATWTTPAVGGTKNWTLLNAGGTALTGAQTITVSGLAKENYLVRVAVATSAGTGSSIFVRVNGDTAANYTYFGQYITWSAGNTRWNQGQIDTTDSGMLLGANLAAGRQTSGGVLISGASQTGLKEFSVTAGVGNGSSGTTNDERNMNTRGIWSGASAITSISVFSSVGNLNGGTVYIYGA